MDVSVSQILPAVFLFVTTPLALRRLPAPSRVGKQLSCFKVLVMVCRFLVLLLIVADQCAYSWTNASPHLPTSWSCLSDLVSVAAWLWLLIVMLTSTLDGEARCPVAWLFVLASVFTRSLILLSHNGTSLEMWTWRVGPLLLLLILCSTSDHVSEKGCRSRQSSAFPSFLHLSWCWHLLLTGWQRKITLPDLTATQPGEETDNLAQRLSCSILRIEGSRKTGSAIALKRALARTFKWDLLFDAFLMLVAQAASIAAPLLVQQLLLFVADESAAPSSGALIGVLLIGVMVTESYARAWHYLCSQKTGVRIRGSLVPLVYQKALRMSHGAQIGGSVGDILNLVTVDADRICALFEDAHSAWAAPLTVVVISSLLVRELGLSALAGISLLLLLSGLNVALITRLGVDFESQRLQQRNERIRLTSELLANVRVVKMYAWEPVFLRQIRETRSRELASILRVCYATAVPQFLSAVTPLLVILVTFGTFVLSDSSHTLTPGRVFACIGLLDGLRYSLDISPRVMAGAVSASVAVTRIANFLSLPDRRDYVKREGSVSRHHVTVTQAILSWPLQPQPKVSRSSTRFRLQVDHLEIGKKELLAVVGSVGSGKSSFLSALLGDMELEQGSISISSDVGKVAFVPQQAWITNQTIRDNILLGQEFDVERYSRVVRSSQLLPDLALLPAGDMTEVGEKGVNLSGGQKQRISIARACYSDAALVLLDDPLSAVDAHVANLLIENVIGPNGILKDRTRILVTSNRSAAALADRVIKLEHGRMRVIEEVNELESINQSRSEPREPSALHSQQDEDGSLMQEEGRAEGRIDVSVYLAYLKSAPLLALAVTLILLSQGLDAGSKYWLSLWSESDADDAVQSVWRLQILGILVLLSGCSVLLCVWTIAVSVVRACRRLHSDLLDRVLHATMAFFESTPIGRILNRFSCDVDRLDSGMQTNLLWFFSNASGMLASLVLISIALPYAALTLVPIMLALIWTHRYGLTSERQVRRLETTTRSFILSHCEASLVGLTSVRAFGIQDQLVAQFSCRLDDFQFSTHSLTDLIALRLLTLSLVVLLPSVGIVLGTVLLRGLLDPGLLGLALVNGLQLPGLINLLVWAAAGLECEAIALERILEYSHLDTEAEWSVAQSSNATETALKENSKAGGITFDNFSARYRPGLELTIKNMDVTIKSGEKVGIVGRTGAGKSTVLLSLLRIAEAAGGRILVHGIDIATLGLHDLRAKISVIPQDPVLFSGTIRFNVDPFAKLDDDEIWQLLDYALIGAKVRHLDGGLDHVITGSGGNLSVGERQLVCLARALARGSKILLLDEATAALDAETDCRLQSAMRSLLRDCTVITIAHRLNTVLDSDRVLVLQDGRVLEFAEPAALLRDPSSAFSALAQEAGIVSIP